MAVVRELVSRWGFDVDEAPLKKLDAQVRSIRNAFAAVGAVAGAGLFAAVKPAATLEAAVKDALTLTGVTAENVGALQAQMIAQANELAGELGISAADIAQGFYQVLSSGAGATSEEFKQLSRIGLQMAKLIGQAPSDAIEGLSDVLNGFKLGLDKAQFAADALFTSSRLVATTVPQMTEAMREAAPISGELGIKLEETTAILSAMAKNATKGTRAGTAFRILLTRLSKPPTEAAAAIDDLRLKVFNLDGTMRPILDVLDDLKTKTASMTQEQKVATLKAIGGEEAWSKLAAVLGENIDELRRWTVELKKSGSLQEAFDIKMDSLNETTNIAVEMIRRLARAFGTPLLKPMKAVTLVIADVAAALAEWLEQRPGLARFLGILTSIVFVLSVLAVVALTAFLFGPKIIALGKSIVALKATITGLIVVTKAFGTASLIAWIKAMLMPIAFAAGIALVILAIGLLIDDFIAWGRGQRSVFGGFLKFFREASPFVKIMTVAIGLLVLGLLAVFAPVVLLGVLIGLLAGLWLKNWDKIKLSMGFLADDISELFSNMSKWAGETFDDIVGWFSRIPDEIGRFLSSGTLGRVLRFVGDATDFRGAAPTASQAVGVSPAASVAARRAGATGRQDIAASTAVTVNVPPGTSAEDAERIAETTRKVVDQQMGKMLRQTTRTSPTAER